MLGTMAGLWISLFLLFFAGMLSMGILMGKHAGDGIVNVEKHTALYLDLSGTVNERRENVNFMQLLQQSGDNTS